MNGFFKNQWTIQALGLLALAVLVWWAGPWWGPLQEDWARGLAIGALLLAWGACHLVLRLAAARKDRELIRELVKEDPGIAAVRKASAEEVESLRRGFEEAARLLGQSSAKDKRGAANLYALPWYVIIGAPGSGKTTALVNSGLIAPHMAKKKLKGIGGTKDCDWWFADGAVFLDTAGRFATQDSHREVDAAAWQGFLQLLKNKKYRPLRPLNGVLVAASFNDLLKWTREESVQHAAQLRLRVQELREKLGLRLPVYMLFTQVDRVAGFTDFFAALGQDEREQVWGETFPAEGPDQPQDTLERFGDAYDALVARLQRRVYPRVQDERDIQRRTLILNFPQQWALLKPALLEFLDALFKPSGYEPERTLLRGVYFTSGTQEGSPIDRFMGVLAEAFGLDRQAAPLYSGAGKSYFLTRLLKQVIFQEAGLAGIDPKLARLQRWAWAGGLAAGLVATLGVIGLWMAGYGQNQAHIARTQDQIRLYRESGGAPAGTRDNFKLLQPKLDALREIGHIWENAGWLAHLGLYQGEKLTEEAGFAYERLLREYLAPSIALRLQERLGDRPDLLLLKAYLMLREVEHFDPQVLAAVVEADWERQFSTEPVVQASLKTHLRNLLGLKPRPLQLDDALIGSVRATLASVKPEERCYDSFKAEHGVDRAHDFKLAEALKPYGQAVFMAKGGKDIGGLSVPALFTAWGYREHFLAGSLLSVQQCMEDHWVLGEPGSAADPREAARLHDSLKALYLRDYQEDWWGMVEGIQPRPAANIGETADLLELLSRPDSPLRRLLVELKNNTALSEISAAAATLVSESADLAARKAGLVPDEQARKLAGAARELAGLNAGTDPVSLTERQFKPLNDLVRGTPNPLDAALNAARDLRNYLVQNGTQHGAAGDAPDLARREFSRLPEPVKGWLLGLTEVGARQFQSEAQGELSDKLKEAGIGGPESKCQAAFGNRYPFNRGSGDDAPLADFGQFFAPGGQMDQFFQANLQDLVDTGAPQWRPEAGRGGAAALSSSTIRQFQHAAYLRDAFFLGGSRLPQVQFDLSPLELAPGVASFHLDSEGQAIDYRPGTPPPGSRWSWPGPSPGSGAGFTFEIAGQSPVGPPRWKGAWAVFRMVDAAVPRKASGADRLELRFEYGGYSARFELRALSRNNPFSLGEARRFHCPESL